MFGSKRMKSKNICKFWAFFGFFNLVGAGSSSLAQEQAFNVEDELDGILDEIVVTARRREEDLQASPVAVTAFSSDSLDARGYTDIASVANATPNLVFDTAPPISGNSAGASVFLRGVGQLDFTINVDPGVGVYVCLLYTSPSPRDS